jgi:hypothetical protein
MRLPENGEAFRPRPKRQQLEKKRGLEEGFLAMSFHGQTSGDKEGKQSESINEMDGSGSETPRDRTARAHPLLLKYRYEGPPQLKFPPPNWEV